MVGSAPLATAQIIRRRPPPPRQKKRHHLARCRRKVPAPFEDQEGRPHRHARSARDRTARALRRKSDAAAGLFDGDGEDVRGRDPVRMGHRFVRRRGRASRRDERSECRASRLRIARGAVHRTAATGAAAGVPAHLKELRRTAIGDFHIADALPYDTLENAPIEELLSPPWFQSLSEVELPLPKLRIDWGQQGKLMRGQSIIMTPSVAVHATDLLALGNPEDRLIAIGEVVNVLREGGPVEVRPKVVLWGCCVTRWNACVSPAGPAATPPTSGPHTPARSR